MALSQNTCLADIKSDLYATLLPDGFTCILLGETVRDDTPIRLYVYSSSSTAIDDGEAVLKPTSVSGAGRWLKQSYQQIQCDWNETTSTNLDFIKNKPAIPAAQINSDWSASSGVSAILNKPIIPAAQINADWNSSGGLSQIFNKPTILSAPSQASVSRILNNVFQSSVTNSVLGIYSVSESVVSALLGTNSGTITLEISPNGTSSWQVAGEIKLSINGVASTTAITQQIIGFIPAGWSAQLVTATSGTNGGTPGYVVGQEITF